MPKTQTGRPRRAATERGDETMSNNNSVRTNGLPAFKVRVTDYSCMATMQGGQDCGAVLAVEVDPGDGQPYGLEREYWLDCLADAECLLARLALFGVHPADVDEIEWVDYRWENDWRADGAHPVVGREAVVHAIDAQRVFGVIDNADLFWSPTTAQRAARARHYGMWLHGEEDPTCGGEFIPPWVAAGFGELGEDYEPLDLRERAASWPPLPGETVKTVGPLQAVATDGHPAFRLRVDGFEHEAPSERSPGGRVAWRLSGAGPDGAPVEFACESGGAASLHAQLALFGVSVTDPRDLPRVAQELAGREAVVHAACEELLPWVFQRLTLFWAPDHEQERALAAYRALESFTPGSKRDRPWCEGWRESLAQRAKPVAELAPEEA
jgi:hypothetical protein